jgi:hypothetical protein
VSWQQLITPNPDVPCRPGWCLEYVRNTFGLPIRYGSAAEAWEKSPSQHPDQNFPDGVDVPVFFAIDTEPNGHIALRMSDGSVYSSSDLGNIPHHHPSIDDLIAYYAYWGKMQLTYLGWSEDVAGFPVVSSESINVDSTAAPQTPQPLEGFLMALTDAEQRALYNNIDYIASAKFKADIFAGTTDLEKNARAEFHQELLKAPIDDVKTGLKTSVSQEIGWLPANFANTPGNVLNAQFKLPDGTVTNLAGILTAINAKPVTTTGGTATVDTQAIATAVVAGIKTQWEK